MLSHSFLSGSQNPSSVKHHPFAHVHTPENNLIMFEQLNTDETMYVSSY